MKALPSFCQSWLPLFGVRCACGRRLVLTLVIAPTFQWIAPCRGGPKTKARRVLHCSYQLKLNKAYRMEILMWIKSCFFFFFFKRCLNSCFSLNIGLVAFIVFFGVFRRKKMKNLIWCFTSITRSCKSALCTACSAALTHQMTQTKICWRWDVFSVPSLKVDEPKRSN